MGFAGYVAVCVQFYCRCFPAKCNHVQEKAKKTSEADSFRNIKVKISYILEDGHVGRNM
jgi:hypothetical protein